MLTVDTSALDDCCMLHAAWLEPSEYPLYQSLSSPPCPRPYATPLYPTSKHQPFPNVCHNFRTWCLPLPRLLDYPTAPPSRQRIPCEASIRRHPASPPQSQPACPIHPPAHLDSDLHHPPPLSYPPVLPTHPPAQIPHPPSLLAHLLGRPTPAKASNQTHQFLQRMASDGLVELCLQQLLAGFEALPDTQAI